MVTQDKKMRTALLLSGQSHHFIKTRNRMMSALSADFGPIDVLSVTWSDKFGTVDTRFNNDVDYLRSVIVPEHTHSAYAQLNSTRCILVSNHELLDEFERMQSRFDTELNVMQFIKYFAGPMLSYKSFQLFKDFASENNITYDIVCRSRFDLLMEYSVLSMVQEEFNKKEQKKIYTKNVEETHADQDSYFGSQETFEYLATTYLKEHIHSQESMIREYFLHEAGQKILSKSNNINVWPESIFLKTLNNLGIITEKKYPYKHTGIYRGILDDHVSVKSIRHRNNTDKDRYSWG